MTAHYNLSLTKSRTATMLLMLAMMMLTTSTTVVIADPFSRDFLLKHGHSAPSPTAVSGCCFPAQWATNLVKVSDDNDDGNAEQLLSIAIDRERNAALVRQGDIVTLDRAGVNSSDFITRGALSRCVRRLSIPAVADAGNMGVVESFAAASDTRMPLALESLRCLNSVADSDNNDAIYQNVGFDSLTGASLFEGRQEVVLEEVRQFRKHSPPVVSELRVRTVKRLGVLSSPKTGICHLVRMDVHVNYENLETGATDQYEAQYRTKHGTPDAVASVTGGLAAPWDLHCAL